MPTPSRFMETSEAAISLKCGADLIKMHNQVTAKFALNQGYQSQTQM